jgi:glycosyltransferase involved in cell wall biosynthesis
MSKDVCFVATQIYPDFVGGAEVFNYYLIGHLSEKNKVSYITLSKNYIIGAKKYQLKSQRNFKQYFEIFKKIIYSPKDRVFVVSFMKTKWYYIIMYPLLNVFLNKKYVIIIHGGGMMQWKWKLPFKLFFKKAKAIFGVSQTICQEYNKRTDLTIQYLPPLIPFVLSTKDKPALREEYKIAKDSKIFLVVGSLKKIKRPMVVLEALNKIDKAFLKNQKVCVLFAGDGDLKNKMKDFLNQNNLVAYVQLLGNIPRDKVNEYYKLSDYYIMSSDFEGTPISMLEAMYNKLCIIGSNAKGINNIINDSNGGFLFNNTNALELSQIMTKVISDEYPEKRENAYHFYNKLFSYTSMVNKFYSNI